MPVRTRKLGEGKRSKPHQPPPAIQGMQPKRNRVVTEMGQAPLPEPRMGGINKKPRVGGQTNTPVVRRSSPKRRHTKS